MNFFPTSRRDRWLLLLFPFRAYVFVAPVCFVVWELVTSQNRIRGAREEAMGIVGIGYVFCFLVFTVVGVLFCFFRNIDVATSAFLFAALTLFFPILIYDNAGMFVITVLVFVFGMKFARDRRLIMLTVATNEYSFQCPVCGTKIPARAEKCPDCAWTYLA